jgi:transcriptional regulator with XRE-family HTH domain
LDQHVRDIGRRVRYWRQRRNLDRKTFADRVGRSPSWVDKIEAGERALERLSMIERVAEALSIPVEVLTDHDAADRAEDCVDAAEVHAIRAALAAYPALGTPQADRLRPLSTVARQAEYLDLVYTTSGFTVVAQHLPELITDAQLHARAAPPADQLDAHRTLVTAYRLASSMLLKLVDNERAADNDIAWLAADRAMQTALATGDLWSLARATRSVARAMTASRQRSHAQDALLAMTDLMRPALTQDVENLLALFGMLFLAASMTAAESEDAALAQQMHEEAMAAATRLLPTHATHNTFFGPTNVAIHRVAALVRLHENGHALEFARTIDPAKVKRLSPERKVSFLLDLVEAHASTSQYPKAVRLLEQAERTAPQEVRGRPIAHGLLRSLLHNTAGDEGRIVRQMALRAGVTA